MNSRRRQGRKPETQRVVRHAQKPSTLPALSPSDGTVEAMKWLALVLMTGDHVNKYLLHESVAPVFDLGRLVMPIFSFVLAFNLARPGALASGAGVRTQKRLMLFCAIASVPFVALGGLGWGWWPINVLGLLAAQVAIIELLSRPTAGRIAGAVAVFVIGGALVEFWWPGLVIGLAAWRYCTRPSALALLWWVLGLAALRVINGNWWALAALPLIFAAARVRVVVPRNRWFFYAYYPAHLAVLWLIHRFA